MKIHFRSERAAFRVLAVVFAMLVAACSGERDRLPAAPVGDKAVLEKLATAYNDVAARLQTSPTLLPPEAKKQFVEQVFRQAGYDYEQTLLQLSGEQMDPAIQYHRDLAELVLLPQTGLSYDDFATIFNQREVVAVQKLLAKMRARKAG